MLDVVLGEGEGHDGDGAGPHDETLRPQTHEPDEGAQRVQDVGVVTAGLGIQLLCINRRKECANLIVYEYEHMSNEFEYVKK